MDAQEYVFKVTADIKNFTRGMDEAARRLQMTTKEAESFSRNLSRALSSSSPDVQRLGRDMAALEKQYSKQTAEIQKFSTGLSTAQQNIGALTQAQTAQAERVAATRQKLQELTAAYNAAKEAAEGLAGGRVKSAEGYSKALEKVQKKLQSVQADLKEYYAAQDEIRASTDRALEMSKTDDQARITLEVEEQELASLNARYAEKLQILKDLEAEQRKITALRDSAREAEALGASIKETAAALKTEETALHGTENSLSGWTSASRQMAQQAQELVTKTAATRDEMLSMSTQAARLTRIGSIFRAIGSAASSFSGVLRDTVKSMRGMATSVGKLIKSGFQKLNSHIKESIKSFREHQRESHNLEKAVKRLTGGFSSFASLLTRRFKRAIISTIFGGLTDSIKSLAKESSSFNAALSSMMGALQQFSNALAGMFQPIIEAAAPVLTSLIGMMTDVADKIGQFTAALFGNGSYSKATPVTYDYAASLDKTTDSTQKATKATKELKREVLSFDQLHILGKNETDDADTATVTTPTAKKFETTPLNQGGAITDFAKRLADAFKAGDWANLGKTLADGVNAAFSWVDNLIKWENCGEKITKIVTGITETFNSFIKNLDAGLIGRTIADFITTVLNTFNLLLTGIDWGTLGTRFGELVMGIFNNLDPAIVGTTIGNVVSAAAEALLGLVNAIDWPALGKWFADAVNSIFTKVNSTRVVQAIYTLVNAVTAALWSFVTSIHWSEIGRSFGESVRNIFSNVNWERIGALLIASIQGVLDLIHGFVSTPGLFETIGRSFRKFLEGAIKQFSGTKWGATAAAIFNGVFTALKETFSDKEKFRELGDKIASNINKFFDDLQPEEFSEAINNMLDAFLEFAGGLIGGLHWDTIRSKVGTALAGIDWGKALKVFGIALMAHAILHFPSLAVSLAGKIVSPLKNALLSDISGMGTSIKGALTTGSGSIAGIFKAAAPVIATAALAVADAVMVAYDAKTLVNAAQTYGNANETYLREISQALDNYKKLYETKGPQVAAQFAKMAYDIDTSGLTLEEGQKALTGKIDQLWKDTPRNMWQGFCGGWDDYFGKGGKGLFGLMGDAFSGAVNGVRDLLGIHSPSTVFRDIGRNICKGTEQGLSGMTSTLNNAMRGVKPALVNPFTEARSGVETAVGRIKSAVNFNDVSNRIRNALSGVKPAISSPFADAKTSVTNNVASINNSVRFDGIANRIRNSMSGVQSAITSPFTNAQTVIENVRSAIGSAWDRIRSWGSSILNSANSGITYNSTPQPSYSGPNVIDLTGYAGGGFPEDGLFLANHGELVGSFPGGKTAVANNAEIVQGIAAGVQDAVAPFMMEILSAIARNGRREDQDIVIDGEKVARVVMRNWNAIQNRNYVTV